MERQFFKMVPQLLQCHVSLATPFAQKKVFSLSSQLNNFLSYLDKMLLLPQSLSQPIRDCVLHMPFLSWSTHPHAKDGGPGWRWER